jgi:hypothetical protein
MVRTLGGCVAVAICSAIHREYLKDRLSIFLGPAQIAAVQKSNSFIAQLPEDMQHRIGAIFGRSYNRQFQVMMAFAGLNMIVTVILALVRKRMGLFGVMPGRQDAKQFMTTEERTGNAVAEGKMESTGTTTTIESPDSNHDPEVISSIPKKHVK